MKRNKAPHEQKALALVREAVVLRPRDLSAHGIPRNALSRLVKRGAVRRIARGLYELADRDPPEHLALMEVCKRVPHGVVCLISALNFHELTTQIPHEVWMAIDVKAHQPKIKYPPTRFVRFSGPALTYGVKDHDLQGVTVRITTPAKTVADCFKFRNKVGLEVAIEALRDYWRNKKGAIDDLWKAAQVCRVAKIMRPYLEATV